MSVQELDTIGVAYLSFLPFKERVKWSTRTGAVHYFFLDIYIQ